MTNEPQDREVTDLHSKGSMQAAQAGRAIPNSRWVDELFAAIDRKDHEAFVSFLLPDACFRFGNNPPLHGRVAIAAAVAGFFSALRSLCHRIEDRWEMEDAAIVVGSVTYVRHDGGTLEVPFANVFKLGKGGIRDYQIFVDNSTLFAE
ncbi:MAG: nuclear transport factor 2 family protein [Rudaea sp.]